MKKKKKSTKAIIFNLSGLFKILTTIAMIVLIVAATLLTICLIALPNITKNIHIQDGIVSVGNYSIELTVDSNNTLNLKSSDGVVSSFQLKNNQVANEVTAFTKYLTTKKVTIFLEALLAISIIEIILMIIIYYRLRKFFKQIRIEKTPFIKESFNIIKSIASILITLLIIDVVGIFLIKSITNLSFSFNIDLSRIIYIVVVYFLAYIFKYGYRLEHQEV